MMIHALSRPGPNLNLLLVCLWSICQTTTKAICSEETSALQPNQIPDNGCLFPACAASAEASPTAWTCVHDRSFCLDREVFVSASDVVAAGRSCTCKDILDFPSLIGACSQSGVLSPMILASDCESGQPVCESTLNPSGEKVYSIGDTDTPFTACDLKCFHGHQHDHVVPDDTYDQCAVPAFEWAVASTSPDGSFSAGNIVSTVIEGVSTVIIGGEMFSFGDGTGEPVVGEVELRGPFTADDPTGTQGTTTLEHDGIAYGGRRPYEMGFDLINGQTGEPIRMVSIEGDATQFVNAMAIGGPGRTQVSAGGDHGPLGNMKAPTRVCTPASGVDGGADTLCDTSGDAPVTTLTSHAKGHLATLVSFSALDGNFDWMIQPWLDLSQQEIDADLTWFSVGITGLAVDTAGDTFAFGHKATQAKEGAVVDPGINGVITAEGIYTAVVSKFSVEDGSEVWRKEFPSTQYAVKGTYDDESNALFVTLEMPGAVDAADELGVTCDHPLHTEGGCSIVARLSAVDGTVEWVRYVHGNYNRVYNVGGAEVAKQDADGPFVYVALQNAGVHGPTTLDAGSAYAGCRADDGSVVPEYDSRFDGMGVLDAESCTAEGLGTFFSRSSQNAIPASAANTGAHCTGASASSCLAKFNKHHRKLSRGIRYHVAVEDRQGWEGCLRSHHYRRTFLRWWYRTH